MGDSFDQKCVDSEAHDAFAGTEPNRQWGPVITGSDWHDVLMSSGFSGADLCFQNHEDQRNHYSSLIVSTASQVPRELASIPQVKIVVTANSPLQIDLANHIKQQLAVSEAPLCGIVHLRDIHVTNAERIFYVFLPELEEPFIGHLSEDGFKCIQNLVASAQGILWAVPKTNGPEYSLATGLSRCLSSEHREVTFVTIVLENKHHIPNSAKSILKVIRGVLDSQSAECETEYVELDGKPCISRLIKDDDLNCAISLQTTPQKPELRPFGQDPACPLSMTIANPGLLDTLQFITDAACEQPLDPNEVEVEVKFAGVNFIDVMIALGQVAANYIGGECAGVVTRAGHGADLKPGDRVCCIAHGTYRTFARCQGATAFKIPDDVSFEAAVSLPTVFCTTYYALYEIARMQSGETILIHCGAGGVDQAAIQLSKLLRADIYVTVGSEEKKHPIMDLYGITEDHIFYSRDNSFALAVKRTTRGRGVDVILNSIAGQGLRDTWDCIATFGRFIEIGKRDIYSHANLPIIPFSRNVVFASMDLKLIFCEKKDLLGKIMRTVRDLFVDGKITGNASF